MGPLTSRVRAEKPLEIAEAARSVILYFWLVSEIAVAAEEAADLTLLVM